MKRLLEGSTFGFKIADGLVSSYVGIVICLTFWDDLRALLFAPFLSAVCFFLILIIAEKFEIENCLSTNRDRPTNYGRIYLLVLLIVFSGQLLYWLAYYPGGFNLDALGQWDQAHGYMRLNNWHPVFTTACYWMITRIFDNFAFCIFIQISLLSFSFAYLALVLYRLGIPRLPLIAVALFVSLNPAIGMNNICLFKDGPFTIALIWATVVSMRTISTNGKWLDSKPHFAGFIAAIVSVVLIRHNGIFFVLPMLICLVVSISRYRKRILLLCASFLLSIAFVQGPIFWMFGVESHDNPTGEMLGIPMSIMANNLVSDPANTPWEVKGFLLSIADESDWNKNYILGEWDSCKWVFGGPDLLLDASLPDVLGMTASSVIASPESAYQAVRENTRVVWQVIGDAEWDTWVYIEDNPYGIKENPNTLCFAIANRLLDLSLTPPGTVLCWNIGAVNLVLMLCALVLIRRFDYARFSIILPILCYNFLTMLLLCGPSHRYFYFCSVLVLPIVLFSMFTKSSSIDTG